MRWHKPSIKAIHSFWDTRARNEAPHDDRIDRVRDGMLRATPIVAPDEPYANLFRQIHRANSLQALWYLRSDLMAAISAQKGEAAARAEIAVISRTFEGLIPEARSPMGQHQSGHHR